jgi:hypothetical protein
MKIMGLSPKTLPRLNSLPHLRFCMTEAKADWKRLMAQREQFVRLRASAVLEIVSTRETLFQK